jgi:hypothetical protein
LVLAYLSSSLFWPLDGEEIIKSPNTIKMIPESVEQLFDLGSILVWGHYKSNRIVVVVKAKTTVI